MKSRTAILALLLASAPALALDHLLKVNEVLVSAQSDPAIQYIELFDPSAGETFPNGPYRVEFFDDQGQFLVQVLTPGISGGAGTEYLIGTVAADAEFGTIRDATLPIALSRDGQACFKRADGSIIHCLRWGCIDVVVGGAASQPGESPPDGSATQCQMVGSTCTAFHVAGTPTPAAPNVAGSAVAPCSIVFNDDFESADLDNWSAVAPP